MTDQSPGRRTHEEKLPAAVLALAPLCDREVPQLSVVQIHTEGDGERTAVATDGRIAGLVQWYPGCKSPHGTPELIPATLLQALQGHIVGAIEPYEGRAPSIKSILAQEPKPDQFKIALNAGYLIRVLQFMQAACGREAGVELAITSATEMVVVQPIVTDCPPGFDVRAAIMPLAPHPDQQTETPPASAPETVHNAQESHGLRITGCHVGAWCPTPDGTGQPQAVALVITVTRGSEPIDLVLRLTSPADVHELADRLHAAKQRVWPDTPPAAHAACDEGEPPHLEAADGISPHLVALDNFARDFCAAGGGILSRAEVVDRLLMFALEHANLVEELLAAERDAQ